MDFLILEGLYYSEIFQGFILIFLNNNSIQWQQIIEK